MSELKPCACGGAARIDYMAGDGDYQIVCEACLRATPRLPSLRKLRSDWDRMFMQSLPHGVRHPLEGAWYRLARWVDEALERALGMTWRMHRGAPPGAPPPVPRCKCSAEAVLLMDYRVGDFRVTCTACTRKTRWHRVIDHALRAWAAGPAIGSLRQPHIVDAGNGDGPGPSAASARSRDVG